MSWDTPAEQARRAANARAGERAEADRRARAAADLERRIRAAAATWPGRTDQPVSTTPPAEQENTMPTPTPSDAVADALARMRGTVANPIASPDPTGTRTLPREGTNVPTPVADAAEKALAQMRNAVTNPFATPTTTRKDHR